MYVKELIGSIKLVFLDKIKFGFYIVLLIAYIKLYKKN